MPGAEEDSEISPTGGQLHESISSRKSIQRINEAMPESTILTGVGIVTTDERGIENTIDEAFWDKSPTVSTAKFALLVSWYDGTMQVTVQSRFLVSVIMGILPRTNPMGIRKRHDSLSFGEPFSLLYWFYDNILPDASDSGSLKGDDSRDLDILRRWYEKNLLAQHVDIRNTINSGYVTFDLLWALYQPNDTVYTRDEFQQPQLHIVSFTEYAELSNRYHRSSYGRPQMAFQLTLLHQDWDSSVQAFKTVEVKVIIYLYAGSRRISDLDVYPLRYVSEDRQDLLASLEARGRRWKSLVTQPSYMVHKGPARKLDGANGGTRKHLDERLIIDHSGYALYREQRDSRFLSSRISQDALSVDTEGSDDFQDEQDPSDDSSALPAQFCPSTVRACSPLTMRWFTVTIENLTEIVWAKDSAKALVMADSKTKDTLAKLIQAHMSADANNAPSDIIEGKGQGLVIVLHGPPGVGKTLTAESMAEVSEKPLLTVDVGQLAFEREVDRRLRTIFEQAVRWGAVLLLDEADGVLEKRSWENHARNAIVSGKHSSTLEQCGYGHAFD
ncbi:hypothetical protein INS49_007557 [Diaporthe citri]|uniref:uncharacterized protein n=1 Tax=Diaporthe citri TaxID=83186 RepID=UPI001C7EAD20|nr:uncharacterized protein INS49_007557 [Diaporthe citri]KAG6353258.1 hypothetical protein INS49_007557 [Diaporthe citri]